MQEYEEYMDDGVEDVDSSVEENAEELLEEDEISTREEAFLKGYESATDEEEDDEEDNKEEE